MHNKKAVMLGWLRERYFIHEVSKVVNLVIRKCIVCERMRAQITNENQIMGLLPDSRFEISPVFTHASIDYAGPILTKFGARAKQKSWIAIFVCMSTKAVQLELVQQLSTESFLMALNRLIAKRGKPACFWSDNGTCFAKTARLLKKTFNHASHNQEINSISTHSGDFLKEANINHRVVRERLAKQQIKWKFIPPRTPHQGGLWETAVKQTKDLLVRLLKDITNQEELITCLACVEMQLNSRPLCPITASTPQALTPGHFLTGRHLFQIYDQQELDNDLDTRWKKVREMTERFWKEFYEGYFDSLQKRQKWNIP